MSHPPHDLVEDEQGGAGDDGRGAVAMEILDEKNRRVLVRTPQFEFMVDREPRTDIEAARMIFEVIVPPRHLVKDSEVLRRLYRRVVVEPERSPGDFLANLSFIFQSMRDDYEQAGGKVE